MNPHLICLRGNPELQDRVQAFHFNEHVVIALADGAGGMSGGAEAAEKFIRIVETQRDCLSNASLCVKLLEDADHLIEHGESTGFVLVVTESQIFGASVGDSEARIIQREASTHLSLGQIRKPLLGSGSARPMGFETSRANGILIAATDGLWKYTSLEMVTKVVLETDVQLVPEKLVDLVRLRSGTLPDDIVIAALAL